jgi:hypothetical protein
MASGKANKAGRGTGRKVRRRAQKQRVGRVKRVKVFVVRFNKKDEVDDGAYTAIED